MLSTLAAITQAGFDVHVAAPTEGSLAEALRFCPVTLVPWHCRQENGERWPLEKLRDDLCGMIQRLRPTLVHANSLSTARILGPVAASSKTRSIGHLRDIIKLSAQSVRDLNKNDRLLAVSSATRDFHIEQGLDASKCFVVYNGVDLDQFQPRPRTNSVHRELGLPNEVLLLLTVGQIGLRKATDVAMEAIQIAFSKVPNLHWLIAGERSSNKSESHLFEQELRIQSQSPSLNGRVHFLGGRTDVAELMNECCLLVHAARQEPLGRVFLEAAASGLPVVATSVGGTREIFPTDEDGASIVSPNSPEALAEAMVALATDEERRKQMSASGRRRAEEGFNVESASARLIEQYRAILDV